MSTSTSTFTTNPSPPQPADLPPFTMHITTTDPHTGLATLHTSGPTPLSPWDTSRPTFNYAVPYSAPGLPIRVSSSADLLSHSALLSSGFNTVVLPGGTNLRILELPPGYESIMHRTTSVDFAVVTEGEVELVLDGGERKVLRRGECCVMRATMHAWRNPSSTQWARFVAVVVEAEKVAVGDKVLGEQWGLEG